MAVAMPPLLDGTFPLPIDAPFTRRDALLAGLTDKRLHKLCGDGYLRRPLRSVYVATQVPDTLKLRAAVLALVVPDGCFVTDRTAGWLHGAEMVLAPNDHLVVPQVSVFRPPDEGRLRNVLARSGERTLGPDDLMRVGGIWVTTPLRTALDLGRLLRRDQALAGLDAMLRLERFSHEELLANVERLARQRGVVQLRALAPLADGRAESPGESVLRLRWLDAGLPRPDLQIPIMEGGREIFRLDLGLAELLFAAEYDGAEWHSSPEDRARDKARRRWCEENRNYQIEVFRKENVFGRRQDASERLVAAYRKARRTLGNRVTVL